MKRDLVSRCSAKVRLKVFVDGYHIADGSCCIYAIYMHKSQDTRMQTLYLDISSDSESSVH